ncbi:hypothetical protein [Streptomyces sp. NPDC051636]|uniref:hypothetical protein n=1 Tax=Streptomyces sp. NPDC051636 TaxID=3365663 RepID=UPI0037BAD81C
MSLLERDVLGRVGNVALARLSTDSKILLWITTITVQMIEYGFQPYKERRPAIPARDGMLARCSQSPPSAT